MACDLLLPLGMMGLFWAPWVVSFVFLLSCVNSGSGSVSASLDAGVVDGGDGTFWAWDGLCPGNLERCSLSHRHEGYNIWCDDGLVWVDDLTESYHCAPYDLDDPVCTTGGGGVERVYETCPGRCDPSQGLHFVYEETFRFGPPFDFSVFCEE